MQYPVSTIDDAYRACNPEQPLKEMDDPRYVDLTEVRGIKNFANTIAKRIERTSPAFHQQLVTGHRGCGKSTELYRLKAQLESDKFFTIYMDVEKLLDLGDVSYLDILVGIARTTEEQLRENGLTINSQLLDELYNWFSDKVLSQERKRDLESTVKGEVEIGSKIPLLGKLLAAFTSEIRSGSSQREEIRRTIEKELSVFIELLNQLISAARQKVQQHGFKDLVIIVDGLEKMHFRELADAQSTHAVLFVHHAEQLKAPACSIIYTVPISLISYANLFDAFPAAPVIFPMVKYTVAQGRTKLVEVVAKRVNIDKVFSSPDLVEQLVKMSGGAVRDLMHLVRMACEGNDDYITQADVDYAILTLIREFDRLIREDDIGILRQINPQEPVRADEKYARLLHLRLILEYQNHERWADLHPAVKNSI
jgi:hypothetical protein